MGAGRECAGTGAAALDSSAVPSCLFRSSTLRWSPRGRPRLGAATSPTPATFLRWNGNRSPRRFWSGRQLKPLYPAPPVLAVGADRLCPAAVPDQPGFPRTRVRRVPPSLPICANLSSAAADALTTARAGPPRVLRRRPAGGPRPQAAVLWGEGDMIRCERGDSVILARWPYGSDRNIYSPSPRPPRGGILHATPRPRRVLRGDRGEGAPLALHRPRPLGPRRLMGRRDFPAPRLALLSSTRSPRACTPRALHLGRLPGLAREFEHHVRASAGPASAASPKGGRDGEPHGRSSGGREPLGKYPGGSRRLALPSRTRQVRGASRPQDGTLQPSSARRPRPSGPRATSGLAAPAVEARGARRPAHGLGAL